MRHPRSASFRNSDTATAQIWYVSSADVAVRLGCDPASAALTNGEPETVKTVTAAVVVDGAIYLALTGLDRPWTVARVDSPGATAEPPD